MSAILNAILAKLNEIFAALNGTSIKRLIIYAMLIYPVVIIVVYKNEVSLLLSASSNQLVSVHDLASAQERCFDLKTTYGAEAVMLYVYQPASKNKNYKERITFSTGSRYTPLESTRVKQLANSSRILEEFRVKGFTIITKNSGHYESTIVQIFGLHHIIITPIRDIITGQIIGEVLWCFINENEHDVNELINAGQIFSYDINS